MILRKMLLLVMCPFVGCRSEPQEESSKMPEHAVIVRFAYGRPELEPLFELEERLRGAIDEANVGEYDGNEIAVDGSEGILYMYGPDGDSLFETVRPVLESADFMNGATVVVRYGPPEDGVEERSVRIGT